MPHNDEADSDTAARCLHHALEHQATLRAKLALWRGCFDDPEGLSGWRPEQLRCQIDSLKIIIHPHPIIEASATLRDVHSSAPIFEYHLDWSEKGELIEEWLLDHREVRALHPAQVPPAVAPAQALQSAQREGPRYLAQALSAWRQALAQEPDLYSGPVTALRAAPHQIGVLIWPAVSCEATVRLRQRLDDDGAQPLWVDAVDCITRWSPTGAALGMWLRRLAR